jgi:hypothetical protein
MKSDATLRRLDTVNHSGLRIALGAFRTSPVLSLYAEAGEPSLADRRNYLMGSYVIKMKALSHHPSHKLLLDTFFDRLFNNKPLASIPTGLRFRTHFNLKAFNIPHVLSTVLIKDPPWLTSAPNILFALSCYDKQSTPEIVYKACFQAIIIEQCPDLVVYTDGSISGG